MVVARKVNIVNNITKPSTKKKIKIKIVPSSDNFCMISGCLYVDPVKTEHGQTFERIKLEKWLKKQKTCPATRQIIDKNKIVSDIKLKTKILHWIDKKLVDSTLVDDWLEIQEEYNIDKKFNEAIKEGNIWNIYLLSQKDHLDSMVELANYFYKGNNSLVRTNLTGFLYKGLNVSATTWTKDAYKRQKIINDIKGKPNGKSPYIYFLTQALKFGDPRAEFMIAYEYEYREYNNVHIKYESEGVTIGNYDYQLAVKYYKKASEQKSSPISIIAKGYLSAFYSREYGYDKDFYLYRDDEIDDIMNYQEGEYWFNTYNEEVLKWYENDIRTRSIFQEFLHDIFINESIKHMNRFTKFKLAQLYCKSNSSWLIEKGLPLLRDIASGTPNRYRTGVLRYNSVERRRLRLITTKAKTFLETMVDKINRIAKASLSNGENAWRR